jgi:pyruvate kinase
MARRTKIVATMGPACDAILDEVLAAGVDVIRLNLSHGTVEEHLARLAAVRESAARIGRTVGVLADLPGPKVRCTGFGNDPVRFEEGRVVHLVSGIDPSRVDRLVVDYPTLLADLAPGDKVVIGDGAISLEVDRVTEAEVVSHVVTGGQVAGRPGVHLPGHRLGLASPTARDLELADIMADAGVDFLAISFVRSGDDLRRARAHLGDRCPSLIAKVETAGAIDALDDIVAASDVVMVARGDLGIDCPIEDVPHLQKRIIRTSLTAGVPVICATQMMESMIYSPSPTRAEVSDIANAVFDGASALMLSAETAVGHDPVAVVSTMSRAAERTEREAAYRQWALMLARERSANPGSDPAAVTSAMSHAAWRAAEDTMADAILCCTRSGRTARMVARLRPTARLIGVSPDPATVRRMSMFWGVEPLAVRTSESTDDVIWFAVQEAVERGLILRGELVVVLAGAPDSPDGATDVMRMVRVR